MEFVNLSSLPARRTRRLRSNGAADLVPGAHGRDTGHVLPGPRRSGPAARAREDGARARCLRFEDPEIPVQCVSFPARCWPPRAAACSRVTVGAPQASPECRAKTLSLGCVGSERSIDGQRWEHAATLQPGACQRTREQQDAAHKVGQFCWYTRSLPVRVGRVENHVPGGKALSSTQQQGWQALRQGDR